MKVVPDEELGLPKLLHRLCSAPPDTGDAPEQIDPFHSSSFLDITTAVVFTSAQLKGLFTQTGKKVIRESDNARLHDVFYKAFRVFENFPFNYHDFLEQRQELDEGYTFDEKRRRHRLGRHFGSIYEGLRTQLVTPNFEPLRTEFNSYVVARWGERNTLEPSGECGGIIEGTTYLTIDEAHDMLRMSVKYVEHLISTGQLGAVVRRSGKKQTVLIDAVALLRVKREYEGAVDCRTLGKRLGVASQTIVQLVSNGCLAAITTPQSSGFSMWRLRGDSGEQLLAAVRSKIKPCPEACGHAIIDFRKACLRMNGWKVKISRFIASILANEIAPCGEVGGKRGLHRFTFAVSDID